MDNVDLQTFVGLAFRHAAGAIAGWLISQGYLQADAKQGFIGALVLVGTVALSWWQKSGQAEVAAELAKLKARATTASIAQAMQNKTAQK